MGPMLMSVASDRPPMLPSSRQRSRLLPRWPTPTRIASKEAVEVTCEARDDAYLSSHGAARRLSRHQALK